MRVVEEIPQAVLSKEATRPTADPKDGPGAARTSRLEGEPLAAHG
jgi:hypothetical protein